MKTKSPFIYLFTFFFYLTLSPEPLALSQIPQGFNYQAIARDGTGTVLPNTPLQLMLTIQSSSSGGTIFWKELFSSVTTNNFGLFTVVVGTGTKQVESTVASFDLIDWSVTPKYLKTEIYTTGPSFIDMGTTQLYAVPYAMNARNLTGTSKLGITGTTGNLNEALFEVKNKDGQTVFAVYNEGVRVYVSNGSKGLKGGFAVGGFGTDTKTESTKYLFVDKDSVRIYLDTNPSTKGTKGTFAVGGYDLTKGLVQNYLHMGADSIRMYIDKSTKGLKGGFAVGGYGMTKASKEKYFNIATDAGGVINPAQNRILWYPLKNAFLTGRVRIGTPDSVGQNSFATGYEPKARGQYSQSMGFKTIANGDFSTAIGRYAVANAINSFAFGDSPQATKTDSYAFGSGAQATGVGAYAFGSMGRDTSTLSSTGIFTTAQGDYSIALGQGSRSIGKGSVSLGVNNYTSSDFSSAIGFGNTSSGKLSSTLGSYNTAGGYAVAIGSFNTASGKGSTVMGTSISATGVDAVAIGSNSGGGGIHVGSGYTAPTVAQGNASFAIGHGVKAESYASTVIGQQNALFPSASASTWVGTDPLFVIGNGNSATLGNPNRHNALVVLKNGYIGINSNNPTHGLDVDGDARFTGAINVGTAVSIRSEDDLYDAAIYLGRTSEETSLAVSAGNSHWCNNTVAGDIILRTRNTSSKLFFSNGYADPTMVLSYQNVGIGTSSPAFPLDVEIMGGSYYGTYGWLNKTDPTGKTTSPSTVNYSIWAKYRIACEEFNAVSDARIKDILGFADAEDNLTLIKKLKVINFRYLDKIGFGDIVKQGFSAQDVEKVFPEAVNTSIGYIPDIYQLATNIIRTEDGNLLITLEKPASLDKGEMIKLMLENGETVKKILEVKSSRSFIVEPVEGIHQSVFVYGRQVNDFRTLDYDRIFTIGVGAIQELSKENDNLRSEVSDLRKEVDQLKTMIKKRNKRQ